MFRSALPRTLRASVVAAGRRRAVKMTVQTPPLRPFSISPVLQHKHVEPPKPGEELHCTFITPDGEKTTLEVAAGDSLLDIAHEHDIDLEGACEGSLACSTCHVIVDPDYYEKMEEPGDEENDMLDLAFGLTETSRLGCQCIMSKELDGITVTLPSATRNMSFQK
ncbi:ferredoxin [Saitoella complicata NRRL Y-17804]|nr:ferredoxin [Saitoella complicata NRRL Y-17804]ODQ54897.1 ferredoxin [Saitoella complicata NRRL Y-17804]